MLHALRLELRSLIEHWWLPALAVLLPWPWVFRLFRRLARYPGLYEEGMAAGAGAGAAVRGHRR
jgi:hypothetical protein